MAQTIQSFLSQLKDTARVLDKSETIDLITTVENQVNSSKLRFLILGNTGSGRSSVTNVILGQSELLPVSPIPKAAIPVTINYGNTLSIELAAKNGLKRSVSTEQLRTILTSFNTDATEYENIEIQTDSDLLKTCSFRIETITSKRKDIEWKEILATTDYIILVLKAVAILSESEKKFIRDVIVPHFGLERLVILMNKIDLVPNDEKSSVSELVNRFLGSFESQPILINFSAAIDESSEKILNSGYESIMNLLKSDLLQNSDRVKLATIRQAVEICIAEVEQRAIRQSTLFSTDETELKQLLNKINFQKQSLQERIHKVHNKVEVFINSLIKEKLFREIENFRFSLQEQLSDEVMAIKDIKVIKKHLPGYLETLWLEFFNIQKAKMTSQITEETKRINKIIKEDLIELTDDTNNSFQKSLNSFEAASVNMNNFLMPKRGTSGIGMFSTGLELAGLFMFAASPPVGLAYIGAGAITRIISKKSINTSEKQAIVESAMNTIKELEAQIKKQIDQNFSELTDKFKSAITDLYSQEIVQIRNELEQHLKEKQTLSSKKEDLNRLTSDTIPEFRKQFNQIFFANN